MTPIYTKTITDNLAEFQGWIDQGATFYVGHSGGKDSQAMYAVICSLVPSDQIVVVHCDLGKVEWDGIQGHIRANIDHGLNVVEAIWADGSAKHLIERIEYRHQQLVDQGRADTVSPWPDTANRYCTGELKTQPTWKFIRRHGAKLAINCVGIRAEESPRRSKLAAITTNKKNTNSRRVAIDFYPIFDLTTDEVWNIIETSGQTRHPAYDRGNNRLSCKFCVFGSRNDWRNAAQADPDLYRRYVEMERRFGKTIKPGKPIEEWVGITIDDIDAGKGQPAAIPSTTQRGDETMTTYSSKTNATRAAKKAHGEGNFTVETDKDGRWFFTGDALGIKAGIDAAVKGDPLPAPPAFLDASKRTPETQAAIERSAKASSAPVRAKAAPKPTKAKRTAGANTQALLDAMTSNDGTTVASVQKATGLLPHTIRAMISRLRRQPGVTVHTAKAKGQPTVYTATVKKAA